MVTGAALATINRMPVLLLPGDVFATRALRHGAAGARGPDHLRRHASTTRSSPCRRFWDRIERPEQLTPALLAAMRVLTDPAETGAVTLALPQDVQAEAFDWPEELFEKRVWRVRRPLPEPDVAARAPPSCSARARRPLIVAGGGTIYAEATDALRELAEATGIGVGETQAGKGSLPYDHPQALGAIGATGTTAANAAAREADVILGVGTRWSDFTTASRSLFAADARFINLNVATVDAFKHAGLPLVADARLGLEALNEALDVTLRHARQRLGRDGRARLHDPATSRPAQAEVIGVVNRVSAARATSSSARRARCPATCTSCGARATRRATTSSTATRRMGYEIAGGLGDQAGRARPRGLRAWSATART